MILIIGGAYQGKLAYAKETYQLSDADILDCTKLSPENNPDLASFRCIYHFEAYIEHCLMYNLPQETDFRPDQIVIADDIFCGVVPIDTHLRLWREACGRALTNLAITASSVTRIFCGLPLKVK